MFSLYSCSVIADIYGVCSLLYDYKWDQERRQWVDWISTIPPYKVDTKKSFSDIIVPTSDSVCYSYLLELFVSNNKGVLCVGQTGTGKTVTIMSKLMNRLPENYDPLFLAFSARTKANQVQDLLDSKVRSFTVDLALLAVRADQLLFAVV